MKPICSLVQYFVQLLLIRAPFFYQSNWQIEMEQSGLLNLGFFASGMSFPETQFPRSMLLTSAEGECHV